MEGGELLSPERSSSRLGQSPFSPTSSLEVTYTPRALPPGPCACTPLPPKPPTIPICSKAQPHLSTHSTCRLDDRCHPDITP